MRLAIDSELSALQNPEKTPEIVAQLEATKGRADELRRISSRWQITLNDGVTDLIADMEHDLRDRMRSIQREAEDSIDEGDPGPVWDQFVEWFEHRVSAAVTDTFVWTQERATWLAEKVARHFTEDEVALPVINVDDTRDVLDTVGDVATLDSGRLGAMQKFYIGLKGSYGGVLMVGIITGIIGMSLINPLSLAAGAVIGRKAYKDDTEARLLRRRNEAKMLIRRQVDEIIFQVGKQLRDRLRIVQRTTRDHFTAIADEHHRSLADSVLAAQKAATMYATERDKRVTALRRDLERVDALTKRARAIETGRLARRRRRDGRCAGEGAAGLPGRGGRAARSGRLRRDRSACSTRRAHCSTPQLRSTTTTPTRSASSTSTPPASTSRCAWPSRAW